MSYEYPPILQGPVKDQVAALRDYLVRMLREQDGREAETARQAVAEERQRTSGTGGKSGAGSSIGSSAGTGDAARLRSLIQKTAEDSRDRDAVLSESMGELGYEMRQSYLAKSEFGVYQQEVRTLIEATAKQIVESYGYSESITATQAALGEMAGEIARYLTEINGEIRRGYLEDPDTHETVLGIAIAQQLRFTGAARTI